MLGHVSVRRGSRCHKGGGTGRKKLFHRITTSKKLSGGTSRTARKNDFLAIILVVRWTGTTAGNNTVLKGEGGGTWSKKDGLGSNASESKKKFRPKRENGTKTDTKP